MTMGSLYCGCIPDGGGFPIDVKAMHVDVLCFTGHKGLLGPREPRALCERRTEDSSAEMGGSGVQTYNHHHPSEMPTALEAGTLNGHGIAGLNAALGYIERVGLIQSAEPSRSGCGCFTRG